MLFALVVRAVRRSQPLSTFAAESKIFSLFQISLENFFKTKFYLYHYLRIQPSEIEAWPYYELEYTIENLRDFLEKKKKGEDEQNEKYNNSSMSREMKSQQSAMRSSINTPKMPSTPSYKMPSPSFNMPKKF